jgi:hypothetical protein
MSKKIHAYTRRKKRQSARRIMRGGDVLPPINDQIVENELETNWREANLENLVAVNEKIAPNPKPNDNEHSIFTDNMKNMYKYKTCKTMFNSVKNTPECKQAETEYCDTPVDIGTNRQQFDEKYAACCPTNFFGMSNKSPRCQQMNQKYKDYRQDRTYKADSIVKTDDNGNEIPRKKPWYRFWGGKRQTKRRQTRRREKRRHRL